ncbi:MAG: Helicase associated domain protein [candidate division NC10 bacterium]|nr:Helicase associated domain protein [candidate division NC10 bacterium]
MTGPRHPDARRFVEAGLFSELATFRELERRISALPSERERGKAFEVFAEAYLATQAVIQAEEVWPFAVTPPSIREELHLGSADLGVDGIVRARLGELQAYQVKFRSARPSLTWTELSTFLGLADYVPRRILFTNCDDIAEVLEERRGFYCIRGSDLDRLEADDFAVLLGWLRHRPIAPPKKTPRPDQREAIAAICDGLRKDDRVTAVMACGTGKTLVQLWSAERLGSRRILVLVPSLALLRQTLHVWLRETSWPDLSYLAVCSDPTVKPDDDPLIVRQGDLDFPVTTDSETVRRFLAERPEGVQIVFSTYHSAPEVAKGCPRDQAFDLAIFDEAHWTAGQETKRFAFALTDEHLTARKRLFMTATPRHYNPQQRDEEGDLQLVYSMDQPQTYGPRVYTLSFAEAARRGIICDYQVLISVVTSAMVTEEMLRRGVVTVQGDRVTARQVANQIALQEAVERVGTEKIITFHASVRSAESFTSPDGEGICAHLPEFQAYHVNGTMRAAERDGIMQEFRVATKAVISNARCLTEGVDVPAVDMVAFIAPRRSRVDIVQATGRAMRTTPGKTTGYVFLPLFLEEVTGESIEHAVARAEYEEIWTVLQALQEQDEVLADAIREMREAEGRDGSFDDAHFREKVQILGPAVSLAVLRESITARCVERLAASWDYLFGKLFAFRQRFRHTNVPHAWPEDPYLAAWVRSQRHLRRQGRLAPDRFQRLDRLGFEWEPLATAWDDMFVTLVQFKERAGDCDVPHDLPYDPQLANWVIRQRHLRRQGRLAADRIERLDTIGFKWGVLPAPIDLWDEMFARLVQFKNRFGHCKVLRRCPEDPKLGHWVIRQRQLRRQGRLAADRIERLDTLGFEWGATTHAASWDEMFARLVQFNDRFGHCNVPLGWSEDLQLARWVNGQRQVRKGHLPAERIQRLDALGFKWGAPTAQVWDWNKMVARLVQFKDRFGHCNVPLGWSEDLQLARWVNQQRQFMRYGHLAADRIEQLDALGFEWPPKSD